MTATNQPPKPRPAKVKQKKKPRRTIQPDVPFWMQLNNSSKRPKRKLK